MLRVRQKILGVVFNPSLDREIRDIAPMDCLAEIDGWGVCLGGWILEVKLCGQCWGG